MIDKQEEIVKKLVKTGLAYKKIAQDIDELTAVHPPFITERILLRLARAICSQRLRELLLILPDEETEELLS
jgi:hypothetical protein